MPDSEPATPFIPPRPDFASPGGHSPAVLPAVIPMSPSQVSIAQTKSRLQKFCCPHSPPIRLHRFLVVIYAVSATERILFPIHRHTLHSASHGSSGLLLYANCPTARQCSTCRSTTESPAWPTTLPSWRLLGLDRSTARATSSCIRKSLRCAGRHGPLAMVKPYEHVHPLRRVRRIWPTSAPDEPPGCSRPVRTTTARTPTPRFRAPVRYTRTPICYATWVSDGLCDTCMGSCSNGLPRTRPTTTRRTTMAA